MRKQAIASGRFHRLAAIATHFCFSMALAPLLALRIERRLPENQALRFKQPPGLAWR